MKVSWPTKDIQSLRHRDSAILFWAWKGCSTTSKFKEIPYDVVVLIDEFTRKPQWLLPYMRIEHSLEYVSHLCGERTGRYAPHLLLQDDKTFFVIFEHNLGKPSSPGYQFPWVQFEFPRKVCVFGIKLLGEDYSNMGHFIKDFEVFPVKEEQGTAPPESVHHHSPSIVGTTEAIRGAQYFPDFAELIDKDTGCLATTATHRWSKWWRVKILSLHQNSRYLEIAAVNFFGVIEEERMPV